MFAHYLAQVATAEGNVGLAFGLVIMAGLSTTVGSMFVFCSDYANVKLLAGALGISAGVMIYVSFGEIFGVKAVESFEEIEGIDGAKATRYATFCFFGGIVITYLLDWLVHTIARVHEERTGIRRRRRVTRTDTNISGRWRKVWRILTGNRVNRICRSS